MTAGPAADVVLLFGSDATRSRSFYRAAFGWRSASSWMLAGRGRVVLIDDGPSPPTAGPGWLPSFVVPDVEAVRDRVVRSGGRFRGELVAAGYHWDLLADAEDIVFAVTGAAIARSEPVPGGLGFLDLYTRDVPSAVGLYRTAFQAQLVSEPIDGPGVYHLLVAQGQPVTGILDVTAFLSPSAAPYWLPYFRVGDLEFEVARMVELGARVRIPCTDTSVGEFAVLADPQGVVFGLQTTRADDLLRSVASTAG